MYCVNGKAPYFKTLQEARAYALTLPEIGMNYDNIAIVVAYIHNGEGELVGRVVRPPDDVEHAKELGYYYLQQGSTDLVAISDDGSVAEDGFVLDYSGDTNRYFIKSKDKDLPFKTLDDARKFLYKVLVIDEAPVGAGNAILNADDKVMGFVIKHEPGVVIFGSGRKYHEVRPNGRIGKAVRTRYKVDEASLQEVISFPCEWSLRG